jgi:hypothetical protein
MKGSFLVMPVLAVLVVLGGCQSAQVHTFVGPSSIPDQTYEITVYDGPIASSYAVLFDIPDDSIGVSMKYSVFTEKIGLDSSQAYLNELEARTKGHRIITITDRGGKASAYLGVSNLLNYAVTGDDSGVMVNIEDPYYGYRRSGP